jgi:hypothetical protein
MPTRFMVMESAVVRSRSGPVTGRLSMPTLSIGSGSCPAARDFSGARRTGVRGANALRALRGQVERLVQAEGSRRPQGRKHGGGQRGSRWKKTGRHRISEHRRNARRPAAMPRRHRFVGGEVRPEV